MQGYALCLEEWLSSGHIAVPCFLDPTDYMSQSLSLLHIQTKRKSRGRAANVSVGFLGQGGGENIQYERDEGLRPGY